MPNTCCVPGCKNKSSGQEKPSDSRLSFHSFPIRNAELCAQWLSILNLCPNFPLSANYRICSMHFAPDAFNVVKEYCPFPTRIILKPDALPLKPTEEDRAFEPSTTYAPIYIPINRPKDKTVCLDTSTQTYAQLKSRKTQCDRVPYTRRNAATQTYPYTCTCGNGANADQNPSAVQKVPERKLKIVVRRLSMSTVVQKKTNCFIIQDSPASTNKKVPSNPIIHTVLQTATPNKRSRLV